MLRARRVKRALRPQLPLVFRALIVVMFVAGIERSLYDALESPDLMLGPGFWLVCMAAAMASIVRFDDPVPVAVLLVAAGVRFVHALFCHEEHPVHTTFAKACVQVSALLLSWSVGRRRCIARSSALALKVRQSKGSSFGALSKKMRYVDIFEAGIRLQAALVAVDYSLSSQVGPTGCMLTILFAIVFAVGYDTRRNGLPVLILLSVFALFVESSPVLGFTRSQAIALIAATALGLTTGPGSVSIDECLLRRLDLCY